MSAASNKNNLMALSRRPVGVDDDEEERVSLSLELPEAGGGGGKDRRRPKPKGCDHRGAPPRQPCPPWTVLPLLGALALVYQIGLIEVWQRARLDGGGSAGAGVSRGEVAPQTLPQAPPTTHLQPHPLTLTAAMTSAKERGGAKEGEGAEEGKEQEGEGGGFGRWFARTVEQKKQKAAGFDFERVRLKLGEILRDGILDEPGRWHTVTPEGYRETVAKARASMDEVVERVHSDCVLWLVPPSSRTGSSDGPDLRFQCRKDEEGDLRREPCGSLNLCLVRSDAAAWRKHYRGTSRTKATHRYDHEDLERRWMPKKEEAAEVGGGRRPSAILTMVDSMRYLQKNFVWMCFLNKASYALRTSREFYIWIGGSDSEVLHERNVETVERTFGSRCDATTHNSVSYYKPIAFGAFFRRPKTSMREGENDPSASEDERRLWFLDADTFFDSYAFPTSATAGNNTAAMSLDDYFDLSPQASLLGSQNPSAKSGNAILVNSGLLGLRGRSRDRDDWILDLSALWWYCRCGPRDQGALWLTLFATWSAESNGRSSRDDSGPPFSYPGFIFDNYLLARAGTLPFARLFLPKLQEIWTRDTLAQPDGEWGGATPPLSWSTLPTNTAHFDGGDRFLSSSHGDLYSRPMELPHVLLLPLDQFKVQSSPDDDDLGRHPKGRTNFPVALARKDQPGKKAMLSHTKEGKPCDNLRCWPFVIKGDPDELLPPNIKQRRRTMK